MPALTKQHGASSPVVSTSHTHTQSECARGGGGGSLVVAWWLCVGGSIMSIACVRSRADAPMRVAEPPMSGGSFLFVSRAWGVRGCAIRLPAKAPRTHTQNGRRRKQSGPAFVCLCACGCVRCEMLFVMSNIPELRSIKHRQCAIFKICAYVRLGEPAQNTRRSTQG
jgi:hypothetical protein